jgi:hypothetical protein
MLIAVGSPAHAQDARAPVPEPTNTALITATAEAAVGCAVAASVQGVDSAGFTEAEGWRADPQLPGFRHSSLPVSITVTQAQSGVGPRCVVNATLASQYDQRQLATALQVLLPGQPVNHDSGVLWRFGRSPNGHSLLMVRDEVRAQPEIRFVGAGF